MTRSEFGTLLNLKTDLIAPDRENRPGTMLVPAFITIHNTDNTAAGADAPAHAKFLKNTGYYIHKGKKIIVSWHYTVDDTTIIKHLPINEVGFHAASKGNSSSIGIEICMNTGIDQPVAFLRAARLVAALLFDLKRSSTVVVPHYKWTAKRCPSLLLDDGKPNGKWKNFLLQVDNELARIE